MCLLHSSTLTQYYPLQHSTLLYSAHRCSHNTQSFHNSVFPLLEHPHIVPGPPQYTQCQKQQVNSIPHNPAFLQSLNAQEICCVHLVTLYATIAIICSVLRPLRDHSSCLGCTRPLSICARAPLGALATIRMIACDFMRFGVHHRASCASQPSSRWTM